ncbi:carboxylate--amine ligase [Methanolobus halotolerans]|uniref:ATP-grasp domain-containing protein n=1 Tax=Methanolobus halotolerans TaxID=2052935 RepID=A0A4E0Q2W0_9EURY|nr:ATP-grasp domain-containing protein [Methanolobus halotolerans]TGC11559.1 hypothetical protein CUN85_01450 [Methanolobus halotolerans]
MSVFLTNSSWNITNEAIKSLRRHNIDSVAGDINSPITNMFSRTKFVKYSPPSHEDFIENFYDVCLKNDVDVIFPMSDELAVQLSLNKSLLSEICEVPIADYENFSKTHDKFETYKMAKSLGVPVPQTFIFSDIHELSDFSKTASYPLIIKPRMGGGASRYLRIIKSKEELIKGYLDYLSMNCLPLVQEYIPGSSEQMYMVNILFDKKHNLSAYFMAKKIREYPPSGGITSCGTSISEPVLLEYAKKIFSALDWYGVAEIEFKLDLRTNEFNLIEINPRFWQYLKLPISCGVDFPFLLHEVSIGNEINLTSNYKHDIKYINILKDIPSCSSYLLKNNNKKEAIKKIVKSYDGKKVYSHKHLLHSIMWRL